MKPTENKLKKYGIFNKLTEPTPRRTRPSVKHLNNKPLIVSSNQVSILLNRDDCYKDNFDGNQYKVVRFLLRINNELVFAAEGYPSGHIAAHFQMADFPDPFNAKCFTAGNLFFDKDNKLKAINNKSGDFRPSFDSLQFVLKQFQYCNFEIDSTIRLQKINSSGMPKGFYIINSTELFETLPENQDNEISENYIIKTSVNIDFGKAIFISGQHSQLGEWQYALRMNYDDNVWIINLNSTIKGTEFKFLIGPYDLGEKVEVKNLTWERGENRNITSSVYSESTSVDFNEYKLNDDNKAELILTSASKILDCLIDKSETRTDVGEFRKNCHRESDEVKVAPSFRSIEKTESYSNGYFFDLKTLLERIRNAEDASEVILEIKPCLINLSSIQDLDELMGTLQKAKFRKSGLFSSMFQPSPYQAITDLIFKQFDKLIIEDESYLTGNISGYSRLHHAAKYGVTSLAQELVNKKENINLKTEFNKTPLHIAIFNGKISTVQFLLSKGADPNLETEQKQNALLIALERACVFLPGANQHDSDQKNLEIYSQIIKILINSNKTDINAKISNKETIFSTLVKYHQSVKESEIQIFNEYILSHFETLFSAEQKQIFAIESQNHQDFKRFI